MNADIAIKEEQEESEAVTQKYHQGGFNRANVTMLIMMKKFLDAPDITELLKNAKIQQKMDRITQRVSSTGNIVVKCRMINTSSKGLTS